MLKRQMTSWKYIIIDWLRSNSIFWIHLISFLWVDQKPGFLWICLDSYEYRCLLYALVTTSHWNLKEKIRENSLLSSTVTTIVCLVRSDSFMTIDHCTSKWWDWYPCFPIFIINKSIYKNGLTGICIDKFISPPLVSQPNPWQKLLYRILKNPRCNGHSSLPIACCGFDSCVWLGPMCMCS